MKHQKKYNKNHQFKIQLKEVIVIELLLWWCIKEAEVL